ncbi:FxSxx-COOH cyclophane-containing RiPP peptide [Streptosporangium sp. NPDC051023]|uniref:FxSxx-COOH cyclophane-containing RiPP peptide n=1 Tax=Streptosporangium sp. NPDC051023 TaxID=3155410 RepID=UPI00344EEB0F
MPVEEIVIRDLRGVPLAQLGGAEVDAILERVLPDGPAVDRVAVAAFNSSI